jgi:predicted O-methyltransferase YrrM
VVESAAEAVQLARIAGVDERSTSVFQQLLDELWAGENPFLFADPRQVDDGYPNSNIQPDLIDAILRATAPRFWLEIGTMLGGSAIMTAERVKSLRLPTTVCCIDPFTGDANMWSWEKARREAGEWRYLKLEAGRPTIYERFLANVRAAGHEDVIVPIVCTSLVGIRLLESLLAERRLRARPEVIYLDSAHEPGETLLELQRAWGLLAPGGVLFGDDWLWPSVRHDVQTFAQVIVADAARTPAFMHQFAESELDGAVLLYRGQWVLFKPPAA